MLEGRGVNGAEERLRKGFVTGLIVQNWTFGD